MSSTLHRREHRRERGPGAQLAGVGAPGPSLFPWRGLRGSALCAAAPREARTQHNLPPEWPVVTAQLPTPSTPGGFGRTAASIPVTRAPNATTQSKRARRHEPESQNAAARESAPRQTSGCFSARAGCGRENTARTRPLAWGCARLAWPVPAIGSRALMGYPPGEDATQVSGFADGCEGRARD
jgi:hypothetical protein